MFVDGLSSWQELYSNMLQIGFVACQLYKAKGSSADIPDLRAPKHGIESRTKRLTHFMRQLEVKSLTILFFDSLLSCIKQGMHSKAVFRTHIEQLGNLSCLRVVPFALNVNSLRTTTYHRCI
jgi:hypothetical protein